MYNILENIFLSKELYQSILAPICTKYEMTQAEMTTLLFIAANPEHNTATDVVKARRLTKSAVSMAVRSLEDKGYLFGEFLGGNHRSVYLKVCEKANEIVEEGQKAQNTFLSILTEGFTESEIANLKRSQERMLENVKAYRKSNM